ncbi:ABC transporter permease, partial [Azospirillum brasilense]|nr:ABC transporter permease [Azospirillum brasilense]
RGVGAGRTCGGTTDRVTRVRPPSIALETSKGDLPLALGLGVILMTLSLSVNLAAAMVRETRRA